MTSSDQTLEKRASFVIGTAGHIDHGKTVLVKALTGIDTDRLPEEKGRGISIDLGFASLTLPDGTESAIVDVPGHERFIKNMLAGATGIDLLLLVVAADDGVMPQTLEHLAIADLLGIEAGVVAITKSDLVDSNRLLEVEVEVSAALAAIRFKKAPIVTISAVQGTGLTELTAEISKAAIQLARKTTDRPWRLPIDRVFTMTGAGTVVTGTLWSGELTTAQAAEILPNGIPVRIRSLQVHGRQVAKAKAGQRVAVNLAGIDKDQVRRGDMLAAPGCYHPTLKADVRLRLLGTAGGELKNEARVRFHHGTKETVARLRLFGGDRLDPGKEAYAQLRLAEPVAAYYGDHFVIRRLSPPLTIGGGRILDNRARPVRRREEEKHLAQLAVLNGGRADDIVGLVLKRLSPTPLTAAEIGSASELPPGVVAQAIGKLCGRAVIRQLKFKQAEYFILIDTFEQLKKDVSGYLDKFRQQNPYLVGIKKEELRRTLWPGLSPAQVDVLLDTLKAGGILTIKADLIAAKRTADNEPKIQIQLDRLTLLLEKELFGPPKIGEIAPALNLTEKEARSLIGMLRTDNKVLQIGGLVFSAQAIDGAKERLVAFLEKNGQITVSEWRGLLGTSRKYALPLLEYFDRERVTKRAGDVRVLEK